MTECAPFLLDSNLTQTIEWYTSIGFTCTATNLIWEPGCELNWARLEWDHAAFMIGPDEREAISSSKDSSLWFNVASVDTIIDLLTAKAIPMEIEPATFYGRKVVSFSDINGFSVSFSSTL